MCVCVCVPVRACGMYVLYVCCFPFLCVCSLAIVHTIHVCSCDVQVYVVHLNVYIMTHTLRATGNLLGKYLSTYSWLVSTLHSVPSSCTLCQPVLMVSTSDE